MLKGIPERIGSDLLKAMADMGHGDLMVIADDFYPPYSKSPNAISIQAKGNGVAEMLEAILQLLPIDTDYAVHPVEYMVPDSDSGVVMDSNKVWDDIKAVAGKYGYKDAVGTIERTKFYEKAGRAFVTVCTSERQPYGCIMLQKGVM